MTWSGSNANVTCLSWVPSLMSSLHSGIQGSPLIQWNGFDMVLPFVFSRMRKTTLAFSLPLRISGTRKKGKNVHFMYLYFHLIRKLYHKQTLKKGFVCVVKKHRKNCDFLFLTYFFFRNLILSPITFLHISIVCMYWSRHHREGGMMGGKKTVFRD